MLARNLIGLLLSLLVWRVLDGTVPVTVLYRPVLFLEAWKEGDMTAEVGTARMEDGRSARKRRAIMEAATTLFLRKGYQGTSMDEIAALAAVSKQTVYKNFADKERLFSDIILGMTERVEEFLQALPLLLQDADDLEETLGALGRRYITSVIHPDVLQVRRLVVREAGRFPDLARTYYEQAPQRTVVTLASCLQRLAERGLLRLEDPLVAANHFAFLILGMPLDRAMFGAEDDTLTAADHERFADAGVRVFLAAYAPGPTPARR
jgi:TetR/AcrR family transcriptional repressor of mexJK operon